MTLLKQPNIWSCGITSLAMVVGASVQEMIDLVGHDGSYLIFPDLADPHGRQGFHTQEFVDAGMMRGYAVVQIEAETPQQVQAPDGIRVYPYPLDGDARLNGWMSQFPGIIVGQYALGKWHAVAWDRKQVYDPMQPRIYTFDDSSDHITIATFLAFVGIKS